MSLIASVRCPPVAARRVTYRVARHLWRASAGVIAVLALMGCAAIDRLYGDPQPVAQTKKSTDDTVAPQLHPWWQVFDDALLQQLIERALQSNNSVESALGALQQARAARLLEVASQRPQLSLSSGLTRNASETATSVTARAGLDASWELDLFGANASALTQQDALVVAAQTNLRDVRLSISAEVALAYLQLRALQAQLEVAQRNLESQQQTLQITQWRAQAGLLTELEVQQALTATAQTSAQIPALQSSLGKARHSLSLLTGQSPKELDALLQPVQAIPLAPRTVADVIDADRLRQRADVRAAEARVTAALASVESARKARYPSFRLGGSVGLTALTLAGLGQGAQVATTVLASMSATLLDGGVGLARVQVQQASLAQTQANYRATLLTALKDVEDAMLSWRNNQIRIDHLEQAASAADAAAQLATQRYTSGLVDFQTVLQTQRTQLSAQDSLTSSRAELSSDFVRLVKAVGGGWQ